MNRNIEDLLEIFVIYFGIPLIPFSIIAVIVLFVLYIYKIPVWTIQTILLLATIFGLILIYWFSSLYKGTLDDHMNWARNMPTYGDLYKNVQFRKMTISVVIDEWNLYKKATLILPIVVFGIIFGGMKLFYSKLEMPFQNHELTVWLIVMWLLTVDITLYIWMRKLKKDIDDL